MFDQYTKKDVRKHIKMQLAGSLVDVELESSELDYCIEFSTRIYRQRADNAKKELGIVFGIENGKQVYDLADRKDINNVIGIYRNTVVSSATSGIQLDPFMLQFTNQMMSYAGGPSGYGSLATVDFQRQHIELLETILAHKIQYTFNKSTKELSIFNYINRDEAVLIVAECWRSDEELFNDGDIYPWILSYATAKAKQILGEARSKFQSIAGPSGGISMNGNELKQEANEEILKLEEELKNLVTANEGYPFIMG